MTEDHDRNEHESLDDANKITNQLNSIALKVDQQRTAAVPTTHISDGSLLSRVTQLATTRKDPVTFWSLPRELRDMIWSEVLGPEDDIFQGNVITSVYDTESEARARIDADRSEGMFGGWYTRRDDGRFTHVTHAPIALSSRPPLPLAHLCQESRAFALHKYDAAYSKARRADLNQGRGERFRWLSRYAARITAIFILDLQSYDGDIEVPLGEDERLILLCHRENRVSWRPRGNQQTDQDGLNQNAVVELLKKAKDYQILIKSPLPCQEAYMIDKYVARKWGVFADRAPGEDFPKSRATEWGTETFVEVRDIAPMVQLLRDINSGGSRRLEEKRLFPYGNALDDLEDRERVQKEFSKCLEPLEELWAANVDEKELSSQSRYGRMPKIGHVMKFDLSLSWPTP
ncbi:hypothetical protein QBC45DRAFT_393311 [Copromyces sp. CBS 386.78]|nr:hypothetical protein QBC45DRAFT_393311 [Copromyces sp. CBS 386.78]